MKVLQARTQTHQGGRVCVCRLIQHTKALMSAEEKLCIKVLRILQEMLIRTLDFDEKVSSSSEEPPLFSGGSSRVPDLSLLQGIPLRKVLLQNYLFPNKKSNPKTDLAELGAAGDLLRGSLLPRLRERELKGMCLMWGRRRAGPRLGGGGGGPVPPGPRRRDEALHRSGDEHQE